MGLEPWKFNISSNKIVIYTAIAYGWNAFCRYFDNLASKSAVKIANRASLSRKISWRIAIKASIRILSDPLKLISAISSKMKKNSLPNVLRYSFFLCSIASNICPVNTIATSNLLYHLEWIYAFLLVGILNFKDSTQPIGVGSLSYLINDALVTTKDGEYFLR